MNSGWNSPGSNPPGRRGGGVEISYINDRGVCWSYLLGIKKAVLVAVRVLSLKRSTVRALVVPLRALRNF